jgi:WD40 repeat protein
MELADDSGQASQKELPGAGVVMPENPSAQDLNQLQQAYRPRTLSSEAREAGQLSARDCTRYFLTLTSALEALHHAGLIHRDIKPSNIIIVGGVAKLADIGLVTAMDSERSFVGTEGFIPPEGPGTAQADIYSLGKVLYEVATGNDRLQFPSLPCDPQTGRTAEALLELNAVLTRACTSEVKVRYQSAAEMHADLALLQSGRSVKQMRAVERKLRVALRAGQIASALAIFGFLLAMFYIHQTRIEKENFRRSEQLRQEREVALVEANLAHASAERLSGRVGRRYAALAAVERATELGGSSGALRSEAVAALAMTDLRAELEIKGSKIITTVQHALTPGLDLRALTDTNGNVLLLRTQDDKEVSRLRGDGKPPEWVGPFSPDGRKLALYTAAKDIVVRDVSSGAELLHLTNEPAWNSNADPGWWVARGFSPDSRSYAVVHGGRKLTLHDLSTGTIREFALPLDAVTLAFRPDGKTIAFAARVTTNQLALLDLDSGSVRSLSLPVRHGAYSLAWDQRGIQLAIGAGDKGIFVFEPDNPKDTWVALPGHQKAVVALAFHPNGRLLISSGWDSTTRLWDVNTARELAQLPRWGWDFIFSADGRRLSFYDAEQGSLKFYDVDDQAVCREIQDAPGLSLNQLAFANDGSWVCLADEDAVRFYSTHNAQPLLQINGGAQGVVPLKGRSATSLSLLLTHSNRLEKWLLQKVSATAWQMSSPPVVELNKVGMLLDSLGGETYGLHAPEEGLWIGAPGTTPRLMDASRYYRRLALSPNGKLAASTGFLRGAGAGRHLVVWDTTTGKVVWHQSTKGRGALAFSPDSQRIATTSLDGVMVWDLAANQVVWHVEKPGTPDTRDSLTWSPDGRLLALTFTLLKAGLLDAATGEVITRLEHPEPSLISSLTFSPDSSQLAAACDSGRVQLWNLRELRRELIGLKLDWNHPQLPALATNQLTTSIQLEPNFK